MRGGMGGERAGTRALLGKNESRVPLQHNTCVSGDFALVGTGGKHGRFLHRAMAGTV
jgi:hypothetical protein